MGEETPSISEQIAGMDNDQRIQIPIMDDELSGKSREELISVIKSLSEENRRLGSRVRELDSELNHLTHLGSIIEESTFEIFVLDKKNLRFIHANKKTLENLGYTAKEMHSLSFYDVTKSGSTDKNLGPLRSGMAPKAGFTTYLFRKDGTCYPVEMHVRQTECCGTKAYGAVAFDVTRLLDAEDKLRETLDHLSKINRYETVIGIVTRSVHKAVDLRTVMENAVQAIRQNMRTVNHVSIYLAEGSVAVMHAHRGYPEWFIKRAGRIQFPKGAVWRTIIDGGTLYIPDTDDDLHIGQAGRDLGIKSYVIVPLKTSGRVLGALCIATDAKNTFRSDELRVVDIVSRQIEIAMGNARFVESLIASERSLRDKIEKLSKKESYEKIINTITRSAHSSADLGGILEFTVSSLRQIVTKANYICIHLAEDNSAVLKASSGHDEEYLEKVRRIPYPRGLTWSTITSGQTSLCIDIDKEIDPPIGPAAKALGVKSYLSVPIRSVASTAGCITLMSHRKNAFSPREVSLLESIAEQIGLAIVNARYVQEIETNERRLKALVGSVDEIVCEMDGNGTYLGIWTDNDRLLVRPKEEMLGRRLAEFYPAGFASKMTDVIRRVISTRKSESAEYKIATDSGERTFRVRVNAITSGGLRQGTASVLFRDITDGKVLETRLLRSQRLDSLGKLAGGIAHDLNNILQPIMMSIQLLEGKTTDTQSRKWLEILESSARRGSDLIKQILSFARGLESSKQPLDMKDVVSDVEKLVRETFPKLVNIHVDITDDLPPVLADYTQINQVFMNLCVNSRDAMPGGGDIFIKARMLRAGRENLPSFFDPGHREYIEISVSDTGTGIPSEDLDRVFDPFFTTKGLDMGTGLGLSTSYGIVKDHEGYINVESKIGKGTTFTIYLPTIESEDMEGSARGLYSGIPHGKGELILVVDDESMITDMARSILEEYKYRVLVASNGKEATEIFLTRKDEVYAAIVDMMMPVMGGKATITTLKKECPALKVIAISGYQREHELVDMHDIEVDAFLPKPFDAETLLQTLSQVLV